MTRTRLTTRRDFLQYTLAAAAGLSTRSAALGFLAGTQAAAVQAADQEYRALVCIFLGGGNDGYNVLIPTDSERYGIYKQARSNLALDKEDLLDLTGNNAGQTYAVWDAAQEMQQMYNNGRLAFVANVGTLLQPTQKKDYESGKNLPPQLFSHSDQTDQAMSSQLDALQRVGWGGRIADLLSNLNGPNALPLGVSIAGNNLFQIGETAVPYYLSSYGVERFSVTNGGAKDPRTRAFRKILEQASLGHRLLEREYANAVGKTLDLSESLIKALEKSNSGSEAWPGGYLSDQLEMVAKMISVRQTFGMNRQVFYVTHGGYDTHDNQIDSHSGLISELSEAISTFHNAMEQLGVASNVTSFTLSEFGRTLTSNGDGTDHSWGNIQMVAGGSVLGGQVYGQFPNQTLDGPDDSGYGRLIPTTSIEQYGATLAAWFGADDSELHTLFPHLDRFATANLGFMSL